MAQSVLEILLKLSGAKRAKDDVKTLEKSLSKLGDRINKVGKGLTVGFTVPLAGFAVVAVNAASDLEESMNKVDVVFGDSAEIVKQFSEDAATALGVSQQEALESAGTFGNLFTAMGVGRDAAADMSTQLLTLAADLGSFNNIDPTVALEKLRAGLVGEAEPLRTLGVNLTAVAVEAKAVEMGLIKAGDEMTNQQLIAARFALIMDQTKNAQGDFARTSDGLANTTRILKAQFKDVAAEIGTNLLPIALDLATKVKDLLEKFSGLSEGTKRNIVIFGGLAAAMGPATLVLGNMLKVAGALVPVFSKVGPAILTVKEAMHFLDITGGQVLVTMGALAVAGIALAAAWKKYQEVQQQVDEGMQQNKDDWAKFLDKQVEGGKSAAEVVEAYKNKQADLNKVLEDTNPIIKLFIDEEKILKGNTEALAGAILATSTNYLEYAEAMGAAGLAADALSISEFEAETGIEGVTKILEEYNPEIRYAKRLTDDFTDAVEDQTDAVQDVEQAMRDLQLFVDGPLDRAIEDFKAGQADIEQQMQDVQVEIQKAISEGYDPMGEKISGLKDKYAELEVKYGENAAAHEDATKRILFDLLAQRAGLDGLTSDELQLLTEISYQWGLVGEDTKDATLAMDGALTALAEGAGFDAVFNTIQAIGTHFGVMETDGSTSMENLANSNGLQALKAETGEIAGRVWNINDGLNALDGKTVNATAIVDIIMAGTGEVGGHGYYQHGGSFIVPPGFPNDTFNVHVSSGELVTVTPQENYNMNIYTSAPYEPIIDDYNMMRARAGHR